MKNSVYPLVIAVALCARSADGQTFTTLLQLSGSRSSAIGSLTLADTRLFGMLYGGANGAGDIFSVGVNGADYLTLVSFTGSGGSANGYGPIGSLTLSGTTLYGMTESGGSAKGYGNVFSVGTDGTSFRNVLSFTGTTGAANGYNPQNGSVTISGTTLYGMTSEGGTNTFTTSIGAQGYGNVFSVGTDGTNYQDLLSFTGTGGAASGSSPLGSVTLSGTTLYGMTMLGGATGAGNVFSVAADGTNYRNLVSFTGAGGTASGLWPEGSLTLSGTTLYGMTSGGGTKSKGNVFSVAIDGTNYRNLLSFTGTGGAASGLGAYNSLILSGTTLYGTTYQGGPHELGNVFSVGIDGSAYQDLYDFTGGLDGSLPSGDLTLSGGTLFGTAGFGGLNGAGTLFVIVLPTPTPEPGTLALLGGVAAGLLACAWRRRRKGGGLRSRGPR